MRDPPNPLISSHPISQRNALDLESLHGIASEGGLQLRAADGGAGVLDVAVAAARDGGAPAGHLGAGGRAPAEAGELEADRLRGARVVVGDDELPVRAVVRRHGAAAAAVEDRHAFADVSATMHSMRRRGSVSVVAVPRYEKGVVTRGDCYSPELR